MLNKSVNNKQFFLEKLFSKSDDNIEPIAPPMVNNANENGLFFTL